MEKNVASVVTADQEEDDCGPLLIGKLEVCNEHCVCHPCSIMMSRCTGSSNDFQSAFSGQWYYVG